MRRVIVIGDSLSAATGAWPNYLLSSEYKIELYAKGGRKACEFFVPTDLKKEKNSDQVVYFLGTGDILARKNSKDTKRHIETHLRALRHKGFTNILVVVPPNFKLIKYYWWNRAHRKMIRKISNNICDVQWVWNKKETWDGIHPIPVQSKRLAMTIWSHLS